MMTKGISFFFFLYLFIFMPQTLQSSRNYYHYRPISIYFKDRLSELNLVHAPQVADGGGRHSWQ